MPLHITKLIKKRLVLGRPSTALTIQRKLKLLALSGEKQTPITLRRKATNVAHYRANKEMYRAKLMKRNASKLNQTPPWADLDEIQAIYDYASLLQNLTGVKIEVDHVMALQAELARGLHVAANLQILPRALNRQKGNTFKVAA